MKKLKEIIEKSKEKERIKFLALLRAEFSVIERGGVLWLTHRGVAFAKIPKDSIADNVTKMLDDARSAAVEFERL